MLRLSKPINNPTTFSVHNSNRPRTRVHVSASCVAKQTPNFYDILSIAPTAGQEEIKAAFKKAALRWHPDTCQTPTDKQLFAERFMQAREAYEVLSDHLHRRCYDISIGIGGGFDERRERGEVYRGWEIQLEGLRRSRRVRSEDTWAARVRRANEKNQSESSY